MLANYNGRMMQWSLTALMAYETALDPFGLPSFTYLGYVSIAASARSRSEAQKNVLIW